MGSACLRLPTNSQSPNVRTLRAFSPYPSDPARLGATQDPSLALAQEDIVAVAMPVAANVTTATITP
jgi:hypothetical protein